MKFFQKRAVAAVVLILAIVAGVVIGQAKKPDTGGQASTAIVGPIRMYMTTPGC